MFVSSRMIHSSDKPQDVHEQDGYAEYKDQANVSKTHSVRRESHIEQSVSPSAIFVFSHLLVLHSLIVVVDFHLVGPYLFVSDVTMSEGEPVFI